jgi:hypothetical protein
MTVQVRESAARRDRQTPSSNKIRGFGGANHAGRHRPTLFSLSILELRPLYESRERLVYPLDPKLRFNLQDFSKRWSACRQGGGAAPFPYAR